MQNPNDKKESASASIKLKESVSEFLNVLVKSWPFLLTLLSGGALWQSNNTAERVEFKLFNLFF